MTKPNALKENQNLSTTVDLNINAIKSKLAIEQTDRSKLVLDTAF